MVLLIIGHVLAMLTGILFGVALQLARDDKLLSKADASCEELVKTTDKLINIYKRSNERLKAENEKLQVELNYYKLGGNTENESVQSSAEVLPLSAELSET